MMRAVVLGVGLWLAAAGMAPAQAPENSLPDGTFASTKDDCAKLATKTPAEIGDEIDFEVLTKKGLTGYRQVCDFVSVSARDAKSWVATAFCDEFGYTYPDLFSIKQKDDGRLNVTRITDLDPAGWLRRVGASRSLGVRHGGAVRGRRQFRNRRRACGQEPDAGRAGRERVL